MEIYKELNIISTFRDIWSYNIFRLCIRPKKKYPSVNSNGRMVGQFENRIKVLVSIRNLKTELVFFNHRHFTFLATV